MQAVNFGTHPTTGVPQKVNTNGGNALNVALVNGSGTAFGSGANNADAVAVSATTDKQFEVAYNYVFNGTSWDRARGDTSGVYQVRVPSPAAAAGIVPVVGKAVTALVVKASPGNFVGGYMIAGAAAGFLIAYNAVAAPGAGAALTTGLILGAVPVAANAPAALGDFDISERFGVGVVLLFSTNIDTYTAPANAALYMKGKAS